MELEELCPGEAHPQDHSWFVTSGDQTGLLEHSFRGLGVVFKVNRQTQRDVTTQ